MPFRSLFELQEFDDRLSIDEQLRAELKLKLDGISASDLPSYTRLAIKSVIDDNVAKHLTWRGTRHKLSIQSFTICSVIKELALNKFSNGTEVEINRVIQQHFVHAQDWVNKREKTLKN
ncbi:uncharacterized protein LOC122320674 [Drosophila ficusphila]|uniref:uncharacterized protein LOC122320674 n=1 Tax=Drosophila ficusphila TaxID=30025 RepID=UPI001C8AB44D|nr:uncharacterized protein LOC122320674 [Drosophila ficusphila]